MTLMSSIVICSYCLTTIAAAEQIDLADFDFVAEFTRWFEQDCSITTVGKIAKLAVGFGLGH